MADQHRDSASPIGGDPASPIGGDPASPIGGDPASPTGGDPASPTGGDPASPTGGDPASPTGPDSTSPTGPGPARMAPVTMSPGGLASNVLPPPDPQAAQRLADALALEGAARKQAVSEVVAAHPRYLAAWADLGDLGDHPIERYAAYRVGYHRGLDALRANGWRGSGYVRSSEPTNQGFLRALRGLQEMATAIGEHDEAARCAQFLGQLDP